MTQPIVLSRSNQSLSHLQAILSRFLTYLRRLHHPKPLPEGVDAPSFTATVSDQLGPLPQGVYQLPPVDPIALCEHIVDLVHHLPSPLSASCEWLDQGALEVDGERPVNAGGVADIWVGMMGNRKVAIKSYRRSSSSDHQLTYVRFCREALVHSRLRGWNTVPFLGVYSTPEHPLALVFEFMDHSNLREYLRNNRDVERLGLLLEIARGVEYVHKINVVHRNIKITNILVDSGGHAYITGLATALFPSTMQGVDIEMFFHGAAPELVNPQHFRSSNTGATRASDVYAFAVLSWEIFAGKVPFSDENVVAAVFSMWKGRRPARPHHPELSDRLWKMIKGCWKVNPSQRKTITEVVAILEGEATARRSKLHLLRHGQT